MAKMIDDKPSFHGEAKTWESFQKLLPMETIVYNNRETMAVSLTSAFCGRAWASLWLK